MILNYVLWIIAGLVVGYLGYYFDRNKKKDLDLHLFIGTLSGYVYAFLINLIIWPAVDGEINFVALIVSCIINYISLAMIDEFFHI